MKKSPSLFIVIIVLAIFVVIGNIIEDPSKYFWTGGLAVIILCGIIHIQTNFFVNLFEEIKEKYFDKKPEA